MGRPFGGVVHFNSRKGPEREMLFTRDKGESTWLHDSGFWGPCQLVATTTVVP